MRGHLIPRVGVVALFAAALAQQGLAREVSVVVHGPLPRGQVEVRLISEPLDGARTAADARREVTAQVGGEGEVDLGLDEVRRWRVSAQAEGFWSEPLTIEPGSRSGGRLELWPAGFVSGRLVLRSRVDPLPAAIQIRFEPAGALGREHDAGPPSGARAPSGIAECPLEKSRWQCLLPAGSHDLRIRVPGRSSTFRFGALVRAGEALDLGDLEPATGSSIIGRLQHPPVPSNDGTGESERPSLRVLRSVEQTLVPEGELVSGPEGVFAATGLPQGRYVVLASGAGYLADRLEVDLGASEEIEVPPLELRRACRIRVDVTPPLDPRGMPWQLLLFDRRPGRGRAPVRESAVDASGKWTFDRAASGRPYRVKLKSSLDEPWWLDDSDFTVSEPETVRKIEMDVVKVSGTARLGKQLLSGRVSFEDRGVSVSLPISREGSFAGSVPRPGAWKARVTSEVMALRRDVDVMVPRGGGEVTLEFPATAVEGEVVDENGVRVPGVSLVLSRKTPPGPMPGHTLDDGAIFLTGLAPGEYTAYAMTLREPYRESLVYDFAVNEDGASEPSPLRIIAPVKRALRGRVVSPEGEPLPGARIQRTASAGDTRTHFFKDYLTDAEGRFSIDIRDDERTPCLVVQAAARPVRILQVSDRDQEQTVAMPAAGGVLQLRAEKTLGQGPRPAGQTGKVLLRGNCYFPVPWFEILRPGATFSMINGESYLQTPLLEPGSYTLCGLMPGEIRNFSGERLPSSNCSTGTLVGGGRLMLEVQ